MIGYRDRERPGRHVLRLEGVDLSFGADGVLWEPGAQQEALLNVTALRRSRFERVESLPETSPVDIEALAGSDFIEEAKRSSRRRRRQTEPESIEDPPVDEPGEIE